jgi:hypothetical protein
MAIYWRKNEKEEVLARKKAEKEALDRAKAEEESREAKRQSRKLNFLLTQTELYSHFIGKKIKTAEAERPDGEDADVGEGSKDAAMRAERDRRDAEIEGAADGEALPDIDYDDGEPCPVCPRVCVDVSDDEENLRKHAARGAQAAIAAARDKARAFDEAMPGAKKKEEESMSIDRKYSCILPSLVRRVLMTVSRRGRTQLPKSLVRRRRPDDHPAQDAHGAIEGVSAQGPDVAGQSVRTGHQRDSCGRDGAGQGQLTIVAREYNS